MKEIATIEQSFVPRKQLVAADLAERLAILLDRPDFERTAEITLVYSGSDSYVRRFEGSEEWKTFLTADWPRIAEVSVYDFGDPGTTMIRADVHRNQITVRAPLAEGKSASAQRAALQSAGDMVELTHDVYRYRRAAAIYRAGSWQLKDFAVALEEVIDDLTKPFTPIVREAYLTYEHTDAPCVERLEGHFDARTFINRLKSQDSGVRKLREIGFSMEGPSRVVLGKPWGCGLGAHVSLDPGPPTLTFRSSLEASDLEDAIKPIRRAVGLGKAIKGGRLGSSNSAEDVRLDDRFPIKHIVLPVVSALILMVFTWQGIGIIFPDYTLIICAPDCDRKEVTMAPGDLEVRWFLKPDQRTIRERQFDVPAQVELFRDGGLVQKLPNPGDPLPVSEATLSLEAGDFTVKVTAEKDVDPASVAIKVSSASW